MAAKEYKEIINKGHKEVFTGLPDKLKKNNLKMMKYDSVIVDICIHIQIGLFGKNQHI